MTKIKFGVLALAALTLTACSATQQAKIDAAVVAAKNGVDKTCGEYKDVADAFDALSAGVKLPTAVITARNTSVQTLDSLCSKPITSYVTAAVQIGRASITLYQALRDAQAAKSTAQ